MIQNGGNHADQTQLDIVFKKYYLLWIFLSWHPFSHMDHSSKTFEILYVNGNFAQDLHTASGFL